jgi:hypothetical protein
MIQIELKFQFGFEFFIPRMEIINYSHTHIYLCRQLYFHYYAVYRNVTPHWQIYLNPVLPSVNYVSLNIQL